MLDYSRRKNFLIKIITDFLIRLNSLAKKTKGFLKDPFICLLSFFLKKKKSRKKIGLPSFYPKIIALFLFVFLISGFIIIRSSVEKNDFCLISLSKIFAESEKNDLFFSSSNSFLPESPEFLLVQNYSLKSSSPPTTFSSQVLGTLVAGYELEEETRREALEHVVASFV